MDPAISGRGAEPVYRDKLKGQSSANFVKGLLILEMDSSLYLSLT